MKLLLISYSFYPNTGGIEVMSKAIAKGLMKLDFQVKIVTSTQFDYSNFDLDVFSCPSLAQKLKLFSWAEVIIENNPSLRLSWPLFFFNKPRLTFLQTWLRRINGKRGLIDHLKIKWVKSSHQVISISKSIQKDFPGESIVIGNFYRSNIFKSFKTKRKNFVFLGRLVSDKGADMCIDLIHQLNKKTKENYKLSIIGDGEELNNLNKKVKELQLENQIQFHGPLFGDELVSKLNEFKFILIPSRWKEPLGIVALEGIACGLIPIVSNGSGLEDAIGNAGISFKRNSSSSLLQSTLKLLDNESLQKKIRSNSVSHLSKYQQEVVLEQYVKVIKSII